MSSSVEKVNIIADAAPLVIVRPYPNICLRPECSRSMEKSVKIPLNNSIEYRIKAKNAIKNIQSTYSILAPRISQGVIKCTNMPRIFAIVC